MERLHSERTSGALLVTAVFLAAWIGAASGQTPVGAAGRGQAGRGFAPVVIGPSAPVPPEVAMLRPAADEIARINAALTGFIAADRSATQPLLEKYRSLIMVEPPRLNTAATFTQTVQRQGPRHEGFVEIAKQGGIDLLLHGDSITDWWVQNDENRAVFQKYFGHLKVANFAVAGDTTQGVLWGLRNGEGQGFQPKAVMLMIGTNNSGSHTAPEIAEGVGAVVLELRRSFPQAKILLLAIFPRGTPADPIRDKIAEVNRIIARLDDQRSVFYLDIGPKFLDANGAFLPNAFRPDNLHPQALGYEIWGEAVQAKLAELMKAPAAGGRGAAPTVVRLQADRIVAAWIERPEPLPSWLPGAAAAPPEAERLTRKCGWYERDRGALTRRAGC